MKTITHFLKITIVITLILFSNNRVNASKPFFAKGADVSWLPQMEASGFKFYNKKGHQEDCLQILKENGINSIRLRTFVNPSNDPHSGHCSKDETIAMALRAKEAGMHVMIDFHYSDSWADPSKQFKPKAWEGLNFNQLKDTLYSYTKDVMTGLKKVGVTPDWVQVGNETPSGMIYPDGSTKNWKQLAELINEGYDAIKSVFPNTKVILHVDQGNNNKRFRNWFDNAVKYGAKFDVIGMSFYPYWLDGSPDYKSVIGDLEFNLNDMAKRYNKDVMVVEIGGEDNKPVDTYNMIKSVIKIVRKVPLHKGLGVFYWEPEGARSWSHYGLSCWQSNGRPTKAIEAFKK